MKICNNNKLLDFLPYNLRQPLFYDIRRWVNCVKEIRKDMTVK